LGRDGDSVGKQRIVGALDVETGELKSQGKPQETTKESLRRCKLSWLFLLIH